MKSNKVIKIMLTAFIALALFFGSLVSVGGSSLALADTASEDEFFIEFDFTDVGTIYFNLLLSDKSFDKGLMFWKSDIEKTKNLEIDFLDLGFTLVVEVKIKGNSSVDGVTFLVTGGVVFSRNCVKGSIQTASCKIPLRANQYDLLKENKGTRQILTVMSNGTGAKVYKSRINTGVYYMFSNDVFNLNYSLSDDPRGVADGGSYNNAGDKNNYPSTDDPNAVGSDFSVWDVAAELVSDIFGVDVTGSKVLQIAQLVLLLFAVAIAIKILRWFFD